MPALAAALGLAAGYVIALLVAPRWALESPPSTDETWLRGDACLHAALVIGLCVAAVTSAITGAMVAVSLSVIVDLQRGSPMGLLFDGELLACLISAA